MAIEALEASKSVGTHSFVNFFFQGDILNFVASFGKQY